MFCINTNSFHCLSTEIGGVCRITEACDWWSLGALLFELLTGMVSEHSTSMFSLTVCTLPANCAIGLWLLIHSAHCASSLCGSSTQQESTPTPSCSSPTTWALQLHPCSLRSGLRLKTHTKLLFQILCSLTKKLLNKHSDTRYDLSIIYLSKLSSIILLHSCFSLMLAIVWALEVEVWVTSNVILSSAVFPGKRWAVSRCSCYTFDPIMLHWNWRCAISWIQAS